MAGCKRCALKSRKGKGEKKRKEKEKEEKMGIKMLSFFFHVPSGHFSDTRLVDYIRYCLRSKF